jgi:hypothetical protein
MKKPVLREPSRNPYVCRTCKEDDFKNSMEFTKHLKRCKDRRLVPAPGLDLRRPHLQVVPLPPMPPQSAALLPMIIDASQKAGELKHSLDALIKRLR